MEWRIILTNPNTLYIGALTAALIVFFVTVLLIKRYIFKKRLLQLLKDPELINGKLKSTFTRNKILSRSNQIEKIARKSGLELLQICGISQFWLEELKVHKRKKLFDRVLSYNPDNGLFTCFLLALEKKDFASRFIEWIDNSTDFLIMRHVALSGMGEQFSGKKSLDLFFNHLPQIREMTGDPEWASRYFAIKVLLYDDNERSSRAIWESFRDSHPLVRRTIASEFQSDNREKLYNELYRLYLSDPVLEVRAAAKERINKDFTDIYNINIENLTTPEALHALEHLSSFSKADEDTAIRFLENENLELRFAAARFLEERGALNRLMEQVDLGDREDLKRIENLLKKSCEVHITSFLKIATKTQNPGAYYIAIDILSETGDVSLIEPICSKIFSLPLDCIENKSLHSKALYCINKRGSDISLKHLNDLLIKNRENIDYTAQILGSIPERGASFFIATLLDFLCDPHFQVRKELRSALNRLPSDLYIQKMLQIIKSGREEYSHIVRKDALKILVELKQSFCLQTILENMPILPLNEAREFAKLLIDYDKDEFNNLSRIIFESDDAAVRSSLISALPAVDGKNFLTNIKDSLSDADPDVRIAAIWALVDFKEKKTVNQAISMLRDPVERVRKEVATAIAETGSNTALEALRVILNDENEVKSVKLPAIYGLSCSQSNLSIDILCELLAKNDDFNNEVISALSVKTGKKEINRIIEIFKDGSPSFRDKLTTVFSKMQEAGESTLIDLLKEDIAALKPFICQVLENTGYIESLIRLLKHRSPVEREKAAKELSFIGTESAFRGIVLAARDSNEKVRIAVTKALEKLNNKEGTEILKSLKEDPDKKVRKYTAWALERINARSLTD